MPSPIRQVIAPGVGLSEATRALGGARRRAGLFPYQWLYPGPNAKPVAQEGSAIMPDAYGSEAVIASYTVPEGMRFSLRGLVANVFSPDWNVGSGDILFTLRVNTVGTRNVEFFTDMTWPRGSSESPWPIPGRLEFLSDAIVELAMLPVDNVTLGAGGGYGIGLLLGHIYPNQEAGEG